MAKTFYDNARLLDEPKNKNEPNTRDIELVLSVINDDRFARYFFDQLENPVWAPILEQHGYFLNAPEPIEVERDSFRIPIWPAAMYLVRVAKSIPAILLAIVEKIETENSRVHELLLDALAQLPAEDSVQALDKVCTWLETRFSNIIPVKYGLLMEKWLSAGFSTQAIRLLEELITPILPHAEIRKIGLHRSPLRFRSDHYWISEVVRKHYSALLGADCPGLVEAYEKQTRRYVALASEIVDLDVEDYTGFRWRLDIPFRSSSSSDTDAYDLLVDGLRDSLVVLCSKSPAIGREKLSAYVSGKHVIFRRLGIFALRSYGRQYPDLLEEVFTNRDYLENIHFRAEYKGLMRDQFGNVPSNIRNKVLDWILAGPLDVDSRALRLAERENRNVEEGDRRLIVEKWSLEHLSLVSTHLVQSPKRTYDNLVAKYGHADIEEKPRISTEVSWGGAPSPIPADQLENMTFDELIAVMIAYKEPSGSFLDPGERLAEVFRSVVQKNPGKYREFAYRLTESNIRFSFIFNFLNGMSEAIKNEKERITEAVITLCESVVAENERQSARPSRRDEPGLLDCQLEVGRLIENTVRTDDLYLTGAHLSRIRAILLILAEHPDPVADNESRSLDPFTQSLNCVRGVAMHGIINYLLYVDRQRKQTDKEVAQEPRVDIRVQKVLQNKLDKAMDSSLAVHSVFGAYLPQLQYLDREWVAQNVEKIFPELEAQSKYLQAAWDAYVFNSSVYGDVFKLLVHQYQRAVGLLSVPREDKNIGSSPNERLAQHIMFLYLNELTDFNHENKLLDLFFANAPDEIRSSAIFWLSKVLESQKPSNQDELWIRLWRLWQVRVKFVVRTDQPNNFRREISDYMRWLANAPVDLGILRDILQQSVRFFHDGYAIQLMAAYAAKHCERYPVEAVTLIHQAIVSATEPWWSPEVQDEEVILRTALTSGNSTAKEAAIELINYRGEQGDFRWKDMLS